MPKFMPDFLTPNDPMAINQFMAPVQQAMTRRVMPDLAPMVNATDPKVRRIMQQATPQRPSAAETAIGIIPFVGDAEDIQALSETGIPALPEMLQNNEAFMKGARFAGPAMLGLGSLAMLMNKAPTGKMMAKQMRLMPMIDRNPADIAPRAFGNQAGPGPIYGPDLPDYIPPNIQFQAL